MTGSTRSRPVRGAAVAAASTLLLAACGSPSERADQEDDEAGTTTLRVGATPLPHAEILEFVDEDLAADKGLSIQVVEYTDYNQPNTALTEGELEANYYQTVPFLEAYLEGNAEADLEYVGDVHLEAFGLYSDGAESLEGLSQGAEIGVPNDASNLGRALDLLAGEGVLDLDEGTGPVPGEQDIIGSDLDVEITPVEAAQLPRSLQDLDAAVVNGNYALEADLVESANVLAWEEAEGNPYANGPVVRSEDMESADVQALDELLHRTEVREFMEQTWDGVVVPVCEPSD